MTRFSHKPTCSYTLTPLFTCTQRLGKLPVPHRYQSRMIHSVLVCIAIAIRCLVKCTSFTHFQYVTLLIVLLPIKPTDMESNVFFAEADAPIVRLDIRHHFEALTEKEKRYAHWMSRWVFLLPFCRVKESVPLTWYSSCSL